MKPAHWKYFFILCICCIFSPAWADDATAWRRLAPGLEYTKLTGFPNFPAGYVHAFRVDLKHYHLKSALVPNDDGSLSEQSFQRLMVAEHAVVATNGGFFTSALKPLGLRVTADQILSPLRRVSWWGVFFIHQKTAHLVRQQTYKFNPPVEFAIEAGPLLVAGGKVLPIQNQKIDSRTAIGVTSTGKIILVATEDVLLSVADLATLMQRSDQQGGLDCVDAINLDGGHSTQLYATLPDFSLRVASSSQVADAVLVVP